MNTTFPPWSDSVPTIEELVDGADELAEAVLNAWGLNAITGHTADFTADFKALANIASAYRVAKQAADSALKAKAFAEKMSSQQCVDYIQLDLLIEQAVADVNSVRESLARASKEYLEKNVCAFVETWAA
jgi:hypothetical protein